MLAGRLLGIELTGSRHEVGQDSVILAGKEQLIATPVTPHALQVILVGTGFCYVPTFSLSSFFFPSSQRKVFHTDSCDFKDQTTEKVQDLLKKGRHLWERGER